MPTRKINSSTMDVIYAHCEGSCSTSTSNSEHNVERNNETNQTSSTSCANRTDNNDYGILSSKSARKEFLSKSVSYSSSTTTAFDYDILLDVRFSTIFNIASLAPPLLSIMLVFTVGFIFDRDQLFNYKWTCGKTLLPSISRIINLPTERIIWNFAILFHTPARLLTAAQNYFNCRKRISYANKAPRRLERYGITLMTVGAVCEIVFLVLLTLIGERESPSGHVICFIGFLATCGLHFPLLTYFTRVNPSIATKCSQNSQHFGNWRRMFPLHSSQLHKSDNCKPVTPLNAQKMIAFTTSQKVDTSIVLSTSVEELRKASPSPSSTVTLLSLKSSSYVKNCNNHNLWDQRKLRLRLTLATFIFAIIITTTFNLNLFLCVKHSYTAFASAEYAAVLAIIAFNATSILDLYKCNFAFVKTKQIKRST